MYTAGCGGGYGTNVSTAALGKAEAGGPTYGIADLSKILFGSGGGAGGYETDPNPSQPCGNGGAGGGIIFIGANSIVVNSGGSIRSNGANAYVGGGGSGGSIRIETNTLSA